MDYQKQFDALVTALIEEQWAKGYLLLIELKQTLANQSFKGFQIRQDQFEFIEREFSFSEEELQDSGEIIKAVESFLEDQAENS